ncbi:hypothetical protein NKR23_g12117, partial [Pleurostoma richardsiae]
MVIRFYFSDQRWHLVCKSRNLEDASSSIEGDLGDSMVQYVDRLQVKDITKIPLNLTAEQSASVLTHPLVRKLTSELRGLRPDSARYLNTRRKLRNAKQTLRRELRERIRDEWTDEQAVDDIRRQLRGIGFAEPIA